jgi:hypothetical protein
MIAMMVRFKNSSSVRPSFIGAALARATGRQETGKLRHIQESAIDGREAMPKRGLINGSFSLFA